MRAVLVIFIDTFLVILSANYSVCSDKVSDWPRTIRGSLDTHKFNSAESKKSKTFPNSHQFHWPPTGTWTPDPNLLLGEYEEEIPTRDTKAYFMTENNTVITVQVGATAALRCQVYDVAEHETVSWVRHRDHHLITVGANTYSNDERFQVTYSEKLQDWTLHVRYAQPRDAGVYECQLSAHPPMGVFTTLHVIEAIAEIDGGPERYVQTGSSVQLKCTLKRFTEPPTYVFWYHGDRMVNYDANARITVIPRTGESELQISQVTKSDSGNYTCQPANARPASTSLHVITGETPAAMQRASATEIQYRFSLALISTLVALIAL